MAVFKSRAYIGGVKFRPVAENQFEVTSTVKIPAGRALVSGDELKFFKVGPYTDIVQLRLRVEGTGGLYDGAAGTWDLGIDGDSDAFEAGGTLGQSGAGGSVIFGEGFTAFTTPWVPGSSTKELVLTQTATVGTQTTADNSDRYVTLTALMQPSKVDTPNAVPYEYADRYNTSGVNSGLYDNG